MPEAPIDQDSDPLPGEDNIRCSSQFRDRAIIHSVPQPQAVKLTPDRNLRSCIAASGVRHPSAHGRIDS
jgi:hypothetical protein